MAERVPELPSQSTKRLPSDREEQRLMISSTIRSRRRPASRLSVQSRNGRMAGRALTIIILCLVLIPLVQHNKILSPLGRPASPSAGDEFGPLITSAVFAAAVQPPTAAFTVSPSSPAAGYPVTLNATSSGGTAPFTFAWIFGDGTNGTDNPAIHTFASGGSYNVTVTIKDSAGALVRTYKIIYVNLPYPPQPAFN